VVGGVETGTFEHDADGHIDFVQRILFTFGAAYQWIIVKTLFAVELNPAILAPIGVYGHKYLACTYSGL
jgi:hypothetical protein